MSVVKLKGTYREGQSPSERLRNKLTPFFFLIDVISDDPNVLSEGTSKDLLLESAKLCKEYRQDIVDHIDDAGTLIDYINAIIEILKASDDQAVKGDTVIK